MEIPFAEVLETAMEPHYGSDCSEQNNPALKMSNVSSDVSSNQVLDWLNTGEIFLVDLRSPEDFEQSRIAGSFLLPRSRLDLASFPKVPGLRTVFVCDQGSVAPKLADDMANAGTENVYALKGGLNAWRAAGFELDE